MRRRPPTFLENHAPCDVRSAVFRRRLRPRRRPNVCIVAAAQHAHYASAARRRPPARTVLQRPAMATTTAADDAFAMSFTDSYHQDTSPRSPSSPSMPLPLTAAALLRGIEKASTPRSKRKLQKHLRSSGLEYVSRTGKLIPAKKVADELCQCPQKCDERVPKELRERLFTHFYGLGDTDLQNAFLRSHMDVRARLNLPELPPPSNGGRSPRRITCKYLVPVLPGCETADVCQKAFVSAFVITTKRVRLQREKLISSMGLNSYGHTRAKQNNANHHHHHHHHQQQQEQQPPAGSGQLRIPTHCDVVDTSSISTSDDEEKSRTPSPKRRLVDDPLIPFGLVVPEGVTIAPVTVSPDNDRDIAIVNNFFSNQLWKPEYILGTYS